MLGLFPVHSPLLRKSLLFYFPPLIKMLQFSGFSYLILGNIINDIKFFNNFNLINY